MPPGLVPGNVPGGAVGQFCLLFVMERYSRAVVGCSFDAPGDYRCGVSLPSHAIASPTRSREVLDNGTSRCRWPDDGRCLLIYDTMEELYPLTRLGV